MKTGTMLKTLSIAALASLSLAGAVARADGCFKPPFQSTASSCSTQGGAAALANQIDARQALLRARIELGLRSGQITPWEAGRLLRAQWEMEQFQRGFLAAGPAGRGDACAVNPDLAAALVPLGDMAASGMQTGMQTASTMMRALMKEASRLIQEQAHADDQPM